MNKFWKNVSMLAIAASSLFAGKASAQQVQKKTDTLKNVHHAFFQQGHSETTEIASITHIKGSNALLNKKNTSSTSLNLTNNSSGKVVHHWTKEQLEQFAQRRAAKRAQRLAAAAKKTPEEILKTTQENQALKIKLNQLNAENKNLKNKPADTVKITAIKTVKDSLINIKNDDVSVATTTVIAAEQPKKDTTAKTVDTTAKVKPQATTPAVENKPAKQKKPNPFNISFEAFMNHISDKHNDQNGTSPGMKFSVETPQAFGLLSVKASAMDTKAKHRVDYTNKVDIAPFNNPEYSGTLGVVVGREFQLNKTLFLGANVEGGLLVQKPTHAYEDLSQYGQDLASLKTNVDDKVKLGHYLKGGIHAGANITSHLRFVVGADFIANSSDAMYKGTSIMNDQSKQQQQHFGKVKMTQISGGLQLTF